MINTKTIKGFSDFVAEDASKRVQIKKIIQEQFEIYGFEPVETPIIESEEFTTYENPDDEAVRDIFRLEDRGKRKLALRYEFTFQLKRISKNKKLPLKVYQIGNLFRDEPIRKGRLRQFIQCDVDIVGSSIKDEAECLALGEKIFEKLGIPSKIYINNRKLTNEILESENIPEKYREQVIREIDKLDKLSKSQVADNLREINAEKILDIFCKNDEKFFEKYSYYGKIKELKKSCRDYGVKVTFKPSLSRGLSYYNGSVFEIWSDKINVSIAGGGSYLINEAQSTGISFGLEPLFLLSKVGSKKIDVQIISLNQDIKAINLAKILRENKISVNIIFDKSLMKALEYANTKKIDNVVIIGEEESKKEKFKFKDMKSSREKLVSINEIVKILA